MTGVPFLKGHGTENDFVILPDVAGELEISPARVRALCERHSGLGGDGVLRVVRTRDVPDAPSTVDGSLWFMDYRNADGSAAEMCGNGIRLFATYLVHAGLAPRGEIPIGTRSGTRDVIVADDGTVTVDMGPATVAGDGTSRVTVSGRGFDGVTVDVGNPHLVCLTDVPVAELDLSEPPGYDPARFPSGVNVEFVNAVREDADPVLRMRVFERGAGETRSCGTGTVAVTAAWLASIGGCAGRATVEVPGGRVRVTVDAATSTLAGPAVLLASGELDRSWWDRQAGF